MRRIRVLQLIKSLGRGGAETLLVGGLRFADRRRFEYRYGYFLPDRDAMVGALESQDVRVVCFHARGGATMLAAIPRVVREIRGWRADLIHSHLPLSGVVGRVAAKVTETPLVYTEHNVLHRYHPATRRLNLLTWTWQQRVFTVSGEVAASVSSLAPPGVPTEVVLNGVDESVFRAEAVDPTEFRRRAGIPLAAPVIGTVAVFRRQKRLDRWLEAARAFRERRPDAHFLLIGDGPLRDEVATMVRDHNLSEHVHVPGLLEDVRPALAATDVFLMTSDYEGLPIALLEAMSMTRPVVSTSVGGIPEVIREGVEGFLVPTHEERLLVDAIDRLVSDPGLRSRMGIAGRRRVVERFGMKRMVGELEGAYEEVVRTWNGA